MEDQDDEENVQNQVKQVKKGSQDEDQKMIDYQYYVEYDKFQDKE